ncbi:hypothetical protein [Oleiharenicola lentus]|uniref:hypothetical protein n=1 Tax=Oleiharenicola lentus TaxID=2508720 RepID=UPI003F664A95
MKTSRLVLRAGFVLILLGTHGRPANAAETKPAPPVPAATEKADSRVSPKTAGEVTRRLPKYDPAARTAAEEKRLAEKRQGQPLPPGEMDDEVLELADMTVTQENKLRGKEEQMRKKKDLLDRALKANPGLKIAPFSKLNNGIALEMQRESKEAAARTKLTEHVENLPATDEARAKEEIRLMRDAVARPNTDWQARR